MVRERIWLDVPRKGEKRRFDGQSFYFDGYVTNKHDLELEKYDLKRKGYKVRTLRKEYPNRYEIYIRK